MTFLFEFRSKTESYLMYEVVEYLEKNNLKYKTLKDGEVICEDLCKVNINDFEA